MSADTWFSNIYGQTHSSFCFQREKKKSDHSYMKTMKMY